MSHHHLPRLDRAVDGGPTTAVAATSLALALCLLGCSSSEPIPVPLLTGTEDCQVDAALGLLTVDPKYGTAIIDEQGAASDRRPTPVMWPAGYTGWWLDPQVVVKDPQGTGVATTGRRYWISGGPVAIVPGGSVAVAACPDPDAVVPPPP